MVINESATLQSLSPLSLEFFDAHVIDASRQDMRVQLNRHVAAQSEVKVRLSSKIVFGQVSYCVPSGDGYRASIEIKETIPTPRPDNA
jgi:hypothetical protein